MVRRAHGWYGFLTTLDFTAKAVANIQNLQREFDRPEGLGEVAVSVSPSEPVDRDLVSRYEELGVDRMILVRDFRDVGRGPDSERANSVLNFIAETPGRLKFS